MVDLLDRCDCFGYGAECFPKFSVLQASRFRCDTPGKFPKFAKRAPQTNCVVSDSGGVDRGEQTFTEHCVFDDQIDLGQRK